MIRKLTFSLLFLIALANIIPAQELPKDKAGLSKVVQERYDSGDYEGAIKAGGKLIDLCRKTAAQDPDSLINSIVGVARIRKEYFIALQYKGNNPIVDGGDRRDAREDAYEIIVDADENYREAVQLVEKAGKDRSVLMASLKRDLGWVTYKHYSRDMFNNRDSKSRIKDSRAMIDEAERYYLEAISLYQELLGPKNKETLMTALDLGDFYFFYNNYDKALGYYEDFLTGYTERNNALLASLRQAAKLYQATFQDKKYSQLQKQIDELTAGREKPVKADLPLHVRSKDAVSNAAKIADTVSAQNLAGIRGKSIGVRVNIVIDETGKVVEAVADTQDKKLAKRAVDTVSKWYVRPLIYKGTAHKLRGYLIYREID